MIWMFCSTGDTDSANKVAEKLEELTVKDEGKTKTSDDKTGGEKKEEKKVEEKKEEKAEEKK